MSSRDSIISLTAPTFAETSGHYTHIVNNYSMAFLLSWVSSRFLAMLTRIYPNNKGKVSGLFSCQAFMNFTPWYLSLATVADLNSLSIKKPMTTCIFSCLMIGAIFFEILRTFLSTRMQVSLRDRSLSRKSRILRNLEYISFLKKSFLRTLFMLFLFSSFGFRFLRLYRIIYAS